MKEKTRAQQQAEGAGVAWEEPKPKTLRDEIAIAAMQGLLASDVYMNELNAESKALEMSGREEADIHPKVVSKCAYELADAMIKAREE